MILFHYIFNFNFIPEWWLFDTQTNGSFQNKSYSLKNRPSLILFKLKTQQCIHYWPNQFLILQKKRLSTSTAGRLSSVCLFDKHIVFSLNIVKKVFILHWNVSCIQRGSRRNHFCGFFHFLDLKYKKIYKRFQKTLSDPPWTPAV